MVRQQKTSLDIQKKVYHTDKFYQPAQTKKLAIFGTAYEVIYNHLSYEHKISQAYIELATGVFWIDKSDLVPIIKKLKSLGYETLSEMSAIDMLAIHNRFEMFYQLHSHWENNADKRRIRLKCFLSPNETIDSVSELFRCALWSEREAYDMFGIIFENHPHLNRILMPQDWVGHPLLKSYPLKGDESASWYEVDKIFGKEYRNIIGPEQRDSARIDEKDTFNFARIGYEQEKGTPISANSNYLENPQPSQSDSPKSDKALFVKNLHPKNPKLLKERR
ncbi:NADH-quinone oxidoreductase subunit C [Helicobacter sp. 11S02596-1]|uniref:NADH-quinone oxidoreductase subunit C n=1 Tax=Helicobacter sp. 11S02596-1 TaxID=1476194 RepID=UPI000BA75556|nr:NADH-quinone oxidoreductase subunit C [Helicobacter sp. 11S02596-1]PAF44278.1 NADH dehydrogenase [Helicobacter sp. 11S02596-1]